MNDTEFILKSYVFAQSDGQEVDLATLQIEFCPIEPCENFEPTAITFLSVFRDSN